MAKIVNLLDKRKRAKLSRRKLASMLERTQQSIYYLENNKRTASLDTALKLVVILGELLVSNNNGKVFSIKEVHQKEVGNSHLQNHKH